MNSNYPFLKKKKSATYIENFFKNISSFKIILYPIAGVLPSPLSNPKVDFVKIAMLIRNKKLVVNKTFIPFNFVIVRWSRVGGKNG